MTRIAHLSDIHFSYFQFSFSHFKTKEWLGNLNYLLHRQWIYKPLKLWDIDKWLKTQNVEHVIFSGDFTTTGSDIEFQIAKNFLYHIQESGMKAYALPGNHDTYTLDAKNEKRFFHHFSPFLQDHYFKGEKYSLDTNQIEIRHIDSKWTLISLDTTLPTPIFQSWGEFSQEMASCLDNALEALKNRHIIIANHYPLYKTNGPRRDLKGYDLLQEVLQKYPNVKLYLHGHTHKHQQIPPKKPNLPLVLNCGSTSHTCKSGLYLIDLFDDGDYKVESHKFIT